MISIDYSSRCVVTAIIEPPDPKRGGDFQSHVIATMDDGAENIHLVGYFSDEISFTADEFIGLTERQAMDLFHKKDVAYLQS